MRRARILGLLILFGCEGHTNDDPGLAPAVTLRASVGVFGQEGNAAATGGTVSADGRFVAFTSDADNLVPGDTNGVTDVFVRDLVLGTTVRVSLDPSGNEFADPSQSPAISADGRYVAFECELASGQQIYRRDLQAGVTELVTEAATGGPADWECLMPAISADGRYVVFHTYATNLGVAGGDFYYDVIRRDMTVPASAGGHQLVSADSAGMEPGGSASWRASISADGRWVAFQSRAALAAGDTNAGEWDIYVRDMDDTVTFAMVRISVNVSGGDPTEGEFDFFTPCEWPSISADGNFVVFESFADDLVTGDTNGVSDIFVGARAGGPLRRASVHSAGTESRTVAQTGTDGSFRPSLSGDGRFVAFHSNAFNLVDGDSNQAFDVFVRDLVGGTILRASVRTFGTETLFGFDSQYPALSSDGRFAAYVSGATNLVDGDTNGLEDVFLSGPLH